MRTLIVTALLIAAIPLTAGCLGGPGDALGDCETLDIAIFTPGSGPGSPAPRAPEEPVPVMVWAENIASVALLVQADLGPEAQVIASSLPTDDAPLDGGRLEPGERWFLAAELTPSDPGANLTVEITTDATGLEGDAREITCDHNVTHELETQTEAPEEAPRAEGGKGVLVRTVGWWTNGTSFYTNLERYHARTDLPGGYLSDYDGADPLKVYVYNESSDERPERYNDSGYVTTIPGFNAALHGLATVGGRVVYLEPGQAYTRDGYEDHALYGDALVFYIEALEVTTVPCEVPQPVCTVPEPALAPLEPSRGPGALSS